MHKPMIFFFMAFNVLKILNDVLLHVYDVDYVTN